MKTSSLNLCLFLCVVCGFFGLCTFLMCLDAKPAPVDYSAMSIEQLKAVEIPSE